MIDVYGDFGQTGVREWHTVLVASAGGSNRELFALDVTNPLKPVLLWDLQSSFDNRAPASVQYAPGWLADDDTGLSSIAQAFQWQNGCHAGISTACSAASFLLPPASDPGRSTTGLYNYTHLGASYSVSAAAIRRNNVPVFAAFIATNEPESLQDSGMGTYVFALDLVTGQKLWEFNQPYSQGSGDPAAELNGIGNTPPAGVTLLSKAGNAIIDTAYVGDEEGSLWELDAADGLNDTSAASVLTGCAGPNCNFPLSQAYGDGTKGPQPISTLATVFVVPTNYPSNGPLAQYTNQALLAYGTAGTDVISALEPGSGCSGGGCINGYLHLLPIAPNGRYNATQISASASLRTTVQQVGTAKEVTNYPLQLPAGERAFGSIVAAGSNLFFATSQGSASQIGNYGTQNGQSYNFDLTAALNTAAPFTASAIANSAYGGAGGTPLLYNDATHGSVLITNTDQRIVVSALPGSFNAQGPSVNGKGQTAANFLGWFFRRRGSEF